MCPEINSDLRSSRHGLGHGFATDLQAATTTSAPNERSPRGITAETGEPYLGHTPARIARSSEIFQETIERIGKEGKAPTRGRVVAGLSFGFWRALFDRKYQQLWVAYLHRAFPHGSGERAEVAGLMSRLVPFRNRLAHHETIIRRPISSHYDEMLQLAGIIDPDARAWIESVTRVPETLNERPQRH
jgi:hypothetical protein